MATGTGQYEIVEYRSAKAFIESCGEYLGRDEALNATLISSANLIDEKQGIFSEPFWFAGINKADNVRVGCAIHSQPDGLIIAGVDKEAADVLFAAVNSAIGPPNRISGCPELVDELSRRWVDEFEKAVELSNNWHIYRLDAVREGRREAEGSLRRGRSGDEETVQQWGHQYFDEKPAFTSIANFFLRKLGRGELYIWDDNGPKCVVTLSGRTTNGIKISGVYTPREHRARGYAAAAVRSICREMLNNEVSFVSLNAEAGDPAERLYERIGFYIIGSQKSVTFKREDET